MPGGVSLEHAKRHPTREAGWYPAWLRSWGLIALARMPRSGRARPLSSVPPMHLGAARGALGRVVKISGMACSRRPDLHHEELPISWTNGYNRCRNASRPFEAQVQQLKTRSEQVPAGEDAPTGHSRPARTSPRVASAQGSDSAAATAFYLSVRHTHTGPDSESGNADSRIGSTRPLSSVVVLLPRRRSKPSGNQTTLPLLRITATTHKAPVQVDHRDGRCLVKV